ncbi:MAG: hypothetical protein ACYCOU_14560 [Sulfobacillus sp.]
MNNRVEICPQCRRYPLEYRTLQITGDMYAFCENYPECGYVSHMKTADPLVKKISHTA